MHDDTITEITDYFDAYRCEPEATYEIPRLSAEDRRLSIELAVVGGGEVGKEYGPNDWVWAVRLDGDLVLSGAALHSGTPHTHDYMARELAIFLTADPERYSPLGGEYERLNMWIEDMSLDMSSDF